LLLLLLAAYVLYITVSGVLSGAADTVAVKTTRAALGGFVPVVGGIIGDAAEAILAGASVIRASIGVFGLLAVLAIALTPFIRLGIAYLLFKLTAALAGITAEPKLVKLLGDIGSAFGLILGMVGAGVFILFVAILSSMRAVGL
jgi:stage III sporulation protein AE